MLLPCKQKHLQIKLWLYARGRGVLNEVEKLKKKKDSVIDAGIFYVALYFEYLCGGYTEGY